MIKSGVRRVRYRGSQRRDFARGIAELAAAVEEGREPSLSAEFCVHTTEVVLSIHESLKNPAYREMTTTFRPLEPMSWASR
jgi:hypothetical protein